MMDDAMKSFEALPHSERTSQLWRTALPLVQSWRGASEEMHRMLDDRAQLLGQGVDAADLRVKSLEERSWAQYQAARRIFKDAVPAVQAVADSNVKNVEQAKAAAQEVGSGGVTVIAVAMLG